MIELARLRIFTSGLGFDLKFYNPSPNLPETFFNFLFVHQQTQSIVNNYSWMQDEKLVVIGFEARVDSVEHSKELCALVRRYCMQFQIRFAAEHIETPQPEDSEIHAT